MSRFGRTEILDYAQKTFGTKADYPFQKYPGYAALRDGEDGKWFALIMNAPRDRLGLSGDETIDIIDVKCPPDEVEILKGKRGFLPAYHMDKKHWITIVLDGSVPKKEITRLIDGSHELIA